MSRLTKEELEKIKKKYYLVVATGNIKEHNECENVCKELGICTDSEKKKIKKYE